MAAHQSASRISASMQCLMALGCVTTAPLQERRRHVGQHVVMVTTMPPVRPQKCLHVEQTARWLALRLFASQLLAKSSLWARQRSTITTAVGQQLDQIVLLLVPMAGQ